MKSLPSLTVVRVVLLLAILQGSGPAAAESLVPLPGESDYVLELIPFAEHDGLNAMDLTHAGDGSGRVFVATQSGQIYAYDAAGRSLGRFLDLPQTQSGFVFDPLPREPFKGLMYIAFHPSYADADAPGFGRFYTAHQVAIDDTAPDFDDRDYGSLGTIDKRFVLAEWQVNPNDPNRIDPASYRRVLLFAFNTVNNNPHALGQIKFNPFAQPGQNDFGNLYLTVGDGDHANYENAQTLGHIQVPDNPFGKILRINPLPQDGQPYTVPPDNPYRKTSPNPSGDLGSDGPNEVFAVGLRDAQWFSFAKDLDGQTIMLAADIGHLLVEEINLVRPGGNYGWPRYEGLLDFKTQLPLVGPASPPIVQYGHAIPKRVGDPPTGGMTAIMGGVVVSDPEDPSFQGQILFSDLPRGTFMHANYHHALTMEARGRQSTPSMINVQLGDRLGSFADVIDAERGDARLGWDQNNTLYIVSKQTGTIFKTRLKVTGQPVEAAPRIAKTDTSSWGIGVILAVAALLAFELAWIWLIAQRRRTSVDATQDELTSLKPPVPPTP